jgi:hypothetical protein
MEMVDELRGFVRQKNISGKNVRRLREIVALDIPEISTGASTILEVARISPRRRGRIGRLRRERPDLLIPLARWDLWLDLSGIPWEEPDPREFPPDEPFDGGEEDAPPWGESPGWWQSASDPEVLSPPAPSLTPDRHRSHQGHGRGSQGL